MVIRTPMRVHSLDFGQLLLQYVLMQEYAMSATYYG